MERGGQWFIRAVLEEGDGREEVCGRGRELSAQLHEGQDFLPPASKHALRFFTLTPSYYSIITLYSLISFPIVVTCDSSTCVGG